MPGGTYTGASIISILCVCVCVNMLLVGESLKQLLFYI